MNQQIVINTSLATSYLTEKNLERWLRIYDKNGDDLIDEMQLVNVTFLDLIKFFNPPPEDPLMFDCYQVSSSEQVKFLEDILALKIKLNLFDYFIECNSLTTQDQARGFN